MYIVEDTRTQQFLARNGWEYDYRKATTFVEANDALQSAMAKLKVKPGTLRASTLKAHPVEIVLLGHE